MTKKTETTLSGITVTLPGPLSLSRHGADYTINGETPVATIIYLLTNGFNQTMTDAYTSAVDRKKQELAEAAGVTGKEAIKTFAAAEHIVPLLAAAGKDGIIKRLAALEDGSMVAGARGPNGPRRVGVEAFLWAQAKTFLEGKAKEQGKPLPKGDAYQALADKAIAAHGVAWRALFNAQNQGEDDFSW